MTNEFNGFHSNFQHISITLYFKRQTTIVVLKLKYYWRNMIVATGHLITGQDSLANCTLIAAKDKNGRAEVCSAGV